MAVKKKAKHKGKPIPSKGKESKPTKKEAKTKAPRETKNFELNSTGTPTKIWCQFPATHEEKAKVNTFMTKEGHKTQGDLARSLFEKAGVL